MSQIYKLSSGGGGGGITNVTGTYPVVVNVVGTTANVSLAYPVKAYFVSPTIDYTATGLTTIFTVPVGHSFIVTNITASLDTANTVTIANSFNVGTIAPDYFDWYSGQAITNTTAGTSLAFNSNSSESTIASAGTNVIFNNVVAMTAIAATGRIIVEGFVI